MTNNLQTLLRPDLLASGRQENYLTLLNGFSERVLNGVAASSYLNNYRAAHITALEKTFVATCFSLSYEGLPNNLHSKLQNKSSDDTFNGLAQTYLKYYPPRSWDINLYGELFADLIAAQISGGRASDYDWAFVSCIARIEYAISDIYYADNHCFNRANPYRITLDMTSSLDTIAFLHKLHPYINIQSAIENVQIIDLWRENNGIYLSTAEAD